jgi:hypothetical protein
MATDIKLKPDQKVRRYVGIDGTAAVDTLAFGALWTNHFGWKNLMLELGVDPADKTRREDKAHPKLPIRHLGREHKTKDKDKNPIKVPYSDICILPHGVDGGGDKATGTDKLWPGANALANLNDINAANRFMQSFILRPSADQAKSELNDLGQGVVADVVFISSHGYQSGRMCGDISSAADIFHAFNVGNSGGQFNGPGWVLLSNCNALHPICHPGWVKLMQGQNPLRGAVGFQDLAPDANDSVSIFAGFISRLRQKKSFLDAWSETLTVRGQSQAWAVLCHENAKDDNIADWNASALKAIPTTGSKILFFNKTNPTGGQVQTQTDPFEAFWTKGSTRITPANQDTQANKLVKGDKVSITLKLLPAGTPFTDKTDISITLIYIRPDYKQTIDLAKMFKVTGQAGISAPTLDDLNSESPGPADSWQAVVSGTPTEVRIDLECLDFSMLKHPNQCLWLRVQIGSLRQAHDFRLNGAIMTL